MRRNFDIHRLPQPPGRDNKTFNISLKKLRSIARVFDMPRLHKTGAISKILDDQLSRIFCNIVTSMFLIHQIYIFSVWHQDCQQANTICSPFCAFESHAFSLSSQKLHLCRFDTRKVTRESKLTIINRQNPYNHVH